MELNLSSEISANYLGNLVYSRSKKVVRTTVNVERLNHILVKINFTLDGKDYSFRAMLSEQQEGVLLIVQDRVDMEYILSGVSGFLHQKPNVHGGLLKKMDSFYFHIHIKYFNGEDFEIYFMGKEEQTFMSMEQHRKQSFLRTHAMN